MRDKRYKVLIVEDDAVDAEFNMLETKKVLPHCEFRVVASEGTFLEALADFHPDLILSDYIMPGFSGLMALKLALREVPNTPFIVVTGSVDEDTAVDCILAGASNYVVKQQMKRLGSAILHALDEKERSDAKVRADRALKHSEERFRSLFQNNLLVMALINPEDGSLVDVNPSAEQFFGMSREELLSASLLDMIVTDAETLAKIKEEMLAGRRFFEFTLRTPKGELREIEVYCSRILVEERTLLYAVANDISERKAMLQELIAAKERAEESDKLKTAFLQNLSYEIRTPMNGILGFTRLLQFEGVSDEARNSYFPMIEQSGERLVNIINDLVDVAKIETGQIRVTFGWFRIEEEIDRLFSHFEPLARAKGLAFTLRRPAEMAGQLLCADRERVSQILSNLLKNAVKFTASGSISFGYRFQEGEVRFFVSDTGVGIDPVYGAIIFDRFRQVESLNKGFEGSGLGLAISKAYAEKMGGSISYESQPGQGSTFYLTLPLSSALIEGQGLSDKSLPIAETPPPDPTVLVVEDDETSGLLLNHMLSRERVKVLLAASGEKAIAWVVANPEICLVLMDIKMPVMDGYEATKRIKVLRPELPVIAQTAYANAFDRERILASGFDDFISKPIIKKELLSKMERFLQRDK